MVVKRRSQRQISRQAFIDETGHENGFIDCPYCEDTFHYINNGHVDHIVPRSQGGSNSRENLVLVCETCNKHKRAMPLTVFCYISFITPEGVYLRLKKLGKRIPTDMLELLGYDDEYYPDDQ